MYAFRIVSIFILVFFLSGCQDTLKKEVSNPDNPTDPTDPGPMEPGHEDPPMPEPPEEPTDPPGPEPNPDVCVLVEPSSLTFSQTEAGTSAHAVVTVNNCSPGREAVLEIGSLTSLSEHFRVSDPLSHSIPYGLLTSFSVEFAPDAAGEFSSEIILRTNAQTNVISIPVFGTGVEGSDCPIAVATASFGNSSGTNINTGPLSEVQLSSAGSTGQTFEWSVTNRPGSSNYTFYPSHTDANPTIFVDVVGTYQIRLDVFDETGSAACQPAMVNIYAVSDSEIFVELTWEGVAPGTTDAGPDMDIHYRHPVGQWNQAPYTVYWNNITGDWGADGFATLDRDSRTGLEPESVSHINPNPDLDFAVGVHYYADNGFGTGMMTLRVFIDGALQYELDNQPLVNRQFLDVVRINYGTQTVSPVLILSDGIPPGD